MCEAAEQPVLRSALLNMTAAAFPVAGFLVAVQSKTRQDGLPQGVELAFDRFLEALTRAVLLFPEETLRQAVLATIPEDTTEVDRIHAQKQVDLMLAKARSLRHQESSFSESRISKAV